MLHRRAGHAGKVAAVGRARKPVETPAQRRSISRRPCPHAAGRYVDRELLIQSCGDGPRQQPSRVNARDKPAIRGNGQMLKKRPARRPPNHVAEAKKANRRRVPRVARSIFGEFLCQVRNYRVREPARIFINGRFTAGGHCVFTAYGSRLHWLDAAGCFNNRRHHGNRELLPHSRHLNPGRTEKDNQHQGGDKRDRG